ncbi:site-2 protease family protein [Thermus sp.]|uniref:site-2 protease family protein n=1 Tax=Thermus sp. TaxID=275 RepID=UPI0025F5FA69|nr:site-2 protease family protein [Thermus sp.]MCS6868380.1 site-2 protease family protein [Thermus sp.]MCX7849706.1 site-2 protease family protein [Thermus sp.]MDW8017009.1 site-2 protease family protein [Thermus sp.]MDW8358448.1 site-2 protease family protein [Thermus sp.]
MLQRGLLLFRVLGIPIYLDLSFLVVLPLWAFLIGSNLPLYLQLFGLGTDPSLLQGPWPFLLGLLAALGLFLSVLLHELGHALAARSLGVATRRITLWLLGGVAQMERIPREPPKELKIALAGPGVSFALALLFRLVWGEGGAWGFLSHYLAWVNLMLGLFNLLPALPLDGGRVYRALLALRRPYLRATRQAVALSQGVAVALGLLGLLVLNPFLILVAFFVYMASRAEAEATLLAQALEGLKVRDLMTQDPIAIPPHLPVAEALSLALAYRVSGFPVVEGGQVLGVVGLEGLEGADLQAPVARYLQVPLILSPEDEALSALERMAERGYARGLVLEGGRLVGILSKTDLLRAFQVRLLGLDRPTGVG